MSWISPRNTRTTASRGVIYTDIGRDGMLSGSMSKQPCGWPRRCASPSSPAGHRHRSTISMPSARSRRRHHGRDHGQGDLRRHARLRGCPGACRFAVSTLSRRSHAGQENHSLPRCQRRTRRQGVNFVELRDAGDPVEVAKRYDEQGADEITFLDITASSDDRDIIPHVVEQVAEQVFIPLTVGGGVRTVDDVRRLLNAGADKVSINTAAVNNPGWWPTRAARWAASASWWRSTPNRPRPASGRYSPTVAATIRASTRSSGHRRWPRSEPAKSCSPAWIATAPRSVSISA